MVNRHAAFNAYDGHHHAELISSGIVRLRMNDTNEVKQIGNDFTINTGSPHFIRFIDSVKDYPVVEEGRKIRYSNIYKEKGINANFVELLPNNTIFVRTYERGVENETLSCGTGVTAAALAAAFKGYRSPVSIKTLGGELSVEFKSSQTGLPMKDRQACLPVRQAHFRIFFSLALPKWYLRGTWNYNCPSPISKNELTLSPF
jgi:diaminopimelate epimerase